MRLTDRARRQYGSAPPAVQRAFDRTREFLVENLRHSSLHAKKYDEPNDIWQARVTGAWRVYFQIHGDTYLILSLIPHPK